jgi:hypothetical protein
VFEYDDEDEYGQQNEKVIIDAGTNQARDLVKTIGRRKMNPNVHRQWAQEPAAENDEEQMIEDFLNENKKQVIC